MSTLSLRDSFLEFAVEEQSNSSQAAGICGMDKQNSDVTSVSNIQRGLPTPASLADVMLTTRQILNEQVVECLLVCATFCYCFYENVLKF